MCESACIDWLGASCEALLGKGCVRRCGWVVVSWHCPRPDEAGSHCLAAWYDSIWAGLALCSVTGSALAWLGVACSVAFRQALAEYTSYVCAASSTLFTLAAAQSIYSFFTLGMVCMWSCIAICNSFVF